jgi:serine/threonine protein phosphatase PrpC
MPFTTDRITRVGGRQQNEDACGDLLLNDVGCWVVADGLGGHRGGETASSLAVQAVLASFRANPQPSVSALQAHVDAAQQAVVRVQKEQPGLLGMRTTLVVLIADSRQALWAHVGDSRLYCLDSGRIAFCTKDHSVVQAMVNAGELSPREARHDENRNRLLRSLGNSNGNVRAELVDQPRTLYKGTAFLLCTDGFWENVLETEMEIDFAKADIPRDWLGKMETRLLERTTDNSDNYTAMAVFFDSESAPESPAPKRMEDGEMDGSSGRNLGTTVLVAGAISVAMAAAALGIWDWLLIRQLKGATDKQSPALTQPQAQQVIPPELGQRIDRLQQRLDAVCNSDARLKALCGETAQPSSAGAATDTPAKQTASATSTKSKPAKKAKK